MGLNGWGMHLVFDGWCLDMVFEGWCLGLGSADSVVHKTGDPTYGFQYDSFSMTAFLHSILLLYLFVTLSFDNSQMTKARK